MIGWETAITGLNYQLCENLKIILETMYVEKGRKNSLGLTLFGLLCMYLGGFFFIFPLI